MILVPGTLPPAPKRGTWRRRRHDRRSLWARVVTPMKGCGFSVQDRGLPLPLHKRRIQGFRPRPLIGRPPSARNEKDVAMTTRRSPFHSVPDHPVRSRLVPAQPVPAQPVPARPLPAQPVPARPVPARPVPARVVSVLAAALLVVLFTGFSPGFAAVTATAAANATAPAPSPATESGSADAVTEGDWLWPVDQPRQVTNPFQAPAHRYGPGHRGMDIAAPVGTVVHAPAGGVVAFRGVVVDRAVLTIDHGNGLVSSYEPLDSALEPGAVLAAGDEIGVVGTGGLTQPGALHIGVRQDGEYVNPLPLFGKPPRAVLLPCCAEPVAG